MAELWNTPLNAWRINAVLKGVLLMDMENQKVQQNNSANQSKNFSDFSIAKILDMPSKSDRDTCTFSPKATSSTSPQSFHENSPSPSLSIDLDHEQNYTNMNGTVENVKNGIQKISDRKQRTIYDRYQLMQLESAFKEQQYMVGSDREIVAAQLGLTETQVRIWFQNRRCKWRKEMRQQRKLE